MPKVGQPADPALELDSVIALDTETTGVDFWHGAKPFLITICDTSGRQFYWEWDVDPLTRQPQVVKEDLDEIAEILSPNMTGEIILHNPRFDVKALHFLAPDRGFSEYWRWDITQDTLRAGHLLASNKPHDLTSMVLQYLGRDIEPYELRMKEAVTKARGLARSMKPSWRIAKVGDPLMPSAKGSSKRPEEVAWKNDLWLPRALLNEGIGDPEWAESVVEYANVDSASTIALWGALKSELQRRGQWEIYQAVMKVLPVIHRMETNGITVSGEELDRKIEEFSSESTALAEICRKIAKPYPLVLPKAGNNNSLRDFVFKILKLPAVSYSMKTGEPSLDAGALEVYEHKLLPNSKAQVFVRSLTKKRRYDTAISYMEGYRKFKVPHPDPEQASYGWGVLHPSLNPTGTDTLRCSSSNPNGQNISKKKEVNLRSIFGFAEGREGYSLDAENIELRIPAYLAEEKEMIELFERPNDPPYYGKVHLLMFDTIYPELFAKHGAEVKTVYESSYYQWVKNGDFAVQYGSVEESGTADRAYHRPGAFRLVKKRFGKIHGPGGLNEQCIRFAEKYGYIETVPDKSVNPRRGYPLLCTRSEYGKILLTVPLNYKVQGTACWWMMQAMIKVDSFLEYLNEGGVFEGKRWGGYYYICLQVHDELVLNCPRGPNPEYNHPVIKRVKLLMESCGDDLGIPTPVSVDYHPVNWGKGEGIKL